MELVTDLTKKDAVQILYTAMRENPGALWIVKKDKKKDYRLKVLFNFCVTTAMAKNGAYISSDKKGVALIMKSNINTPIFSTLWNNIVLIHNCIGWKRALSVLSRERTIRKKRPAEETLIFWMLGVCDHTNGTNTIIEIRDFAFDLSKSLHLPITAETTTARNKTLYERFGFQLYDSWKSPQNDLTIWFLKRNLNI